MKQVPTLTVTDQIEELAAINTNPDAGGITREVFTSDYMRANEYVIGLMEQAGLAAGATPMVSRRDALSGAAELVVELERLALGSPSGSTVATVGVIDARPGAINVIAGEAEIQVDIRDHDLVARTAVVDEFLAAAESVTARRGLEYDVKTITRDQPAACSRIVVDAAQRACLELELEFTDIVSGAYHDAMVLGAQVPIGMIFVPSEAGISHSPLEYTAPEEIECGVRALAGTLRILADEP